MKDDHGSSHETNCTERVYRDAFTNQFGDKFWVAIDRKKKTGTLTGTDIGDTIKIARNCVLDGVILSEPEFNWLSRCWREATGQELNLLCCPELFFKLLSEAAGTGDKP